MATTSKDVVRVPKPGLQRDREVDRQQAVVDADATGQKVDSEAAVRWRAERLGRLLGTRRG
jgi:hypothetical protein